jgi:hypothetical protein
LRSALETNCHRSSQLRKIVTALFLMVLKGLIDPFREKSSAHLVSGLLDFSKLVQFSATETVTCKIKQPPLKGMLFILKHTTLTPKCLIRASKITLGRKHFFELLCSFLNSNKWQPKGESHRSGW